MSDKPTYLGLLNAIAIAESRAHCYLSAWVAKTENPEVRAVIAMVAAREGEHGMTFARRINELGYAVRDKDDTDVRKRLAIASSDIADVEKMEKLGLDRLDTGARPDIFDDIFKDHTIDIETGALLGRYIAEERDSARRLRSCYEQLKVAPVGAAAGTSDRLRSVETKLDALCAAVETLISGEPGLAPRSTNGASGGKRSRARG